MGLSDLFKKKDKAKKEPEQTKPEVDVEVLESISRTD